MAEYGRWYVGPHWVGTPVTTACCLCGSVYDGRVLSAEGKNWYFFHDLYFHGAYVPRCWDCSGADFWLLDRLVNGD